MHPYQNLDGYWSVVDEDGIEVTLDTFTTEKEAWDWIEWAEEEH